MEHHVSIGKGELLRVIGESGCESSGLKERVTNVSVSKPLRVLMVQAWEGGRNTTFISPPLGINRVRKWAESRLGHDVEIECYDPNLYEDGRERLTKKAREKPYDVIAFSPLHLTMENDLALMHDVHEIRPNALYVAGGQQAAFVSGTTGLLQKHAPHIHGIIIGEGEKPFTEILRVTLTNGLEAVVADPRRYFSHINGMYVRGVRNPGFNGAMSAADFREATFLLDFTDLEVEEYWKALEENRIPEELADPKWQRKIYTLKPYTTNYCPMNCSFCSTTTFYRDAGDGRAKVVGVRGEDLEEYLVKILTNQPRARTVIFKDDLWFIRGSGGRTALLEDLAALRRVRKRFLYRDIMYSGKARVDTFVDPNTLEVDRELFEVAREAGMLSLSFGLESFDANELEYYNKRLGPRGPQVNTTAVKEASRYGINTVSYIILTGLYSTPDSVFRTIEGCTDLVASGEIVKINSYLYALPGTKIEEDIREHPDLAETRVYPVPGYPDISVERVVKIAPADERARILVDRFERELPDYQRDVQKRLGVTDWISEYMAPTELDLMLKIGIEEGYFEIGRSSVLRARLHGVMDLYRRTRREARELTFG